MWIGSGWCDLNRGTQGGRTIDGKTQRQRSHLGDAGRGVNRPSQQLPSLRSAQGINGNLSQKLPYLSSTGAGISASAFQRNNDLYAYMQALAARLRRVRVCCGNWARITGPSVTEHIGLTGVFLDPPYSAEAGRENDLYSVDDTQVAHKVREWALANGDNPLLRIAYCSYDNEIGSFPSGWTYVRWKANGGYGNQSNGQGAENSKRECIFFSPHCLPKEETQLSLWGFNQEHQSDYSPDTMSGAFTG